MSFGKLEICPYLKELDDNKTKCRVYDSRIGVMIGKNEKGRVICGLREKIKKNFKGCPNNKDGYEQMGW